jgi:hypothetical protein
MQLELDQVDLRYAHLRIADGARERRLLLEMETQGQREAVLVVAAPEPERFVLIDGYGRVGVLRRLCRDVVEAVVLAMTETEALVFAHRLRSERRRSALEEAWLLQEVCGRDGLSHRALAEQLGRSPSWVSRRLALVRVLPEGAQEAVRRGSVCAHAAAKYLVPMARANTEQCEQMVGGLGGARHGSRSVERLYRAWLCGDAETRARIAEAPELMLRAWEAAAQPDSPEASASPVGQAVGDIEAAAGLCRRARKALRAHAQEASEREARALGGAVKELGLCLRALEGIVKEERGDAGSRYARGHLDDDQTEGGAEEDRRDAARLAQCGAQSAP